MTSNTVITPSQKDKRRKIRRALFVLGPLLVLAGIFYVYVTGARYMETENAYIKAGKATISAQVTGPVVALAVVENQAVKTGDVLFVLDDKPYKIALEHAEANLQQTLNDINALKASYRTQSADLRLAESDLAFYEQELNRQQGLSNEKMVSDAVFDQAKHQRDSAQLKVNALRQARAQILAALGGDENIRADDHASANKARADRDEAALNLAHTTVTAPFAGLTHNMPQIGDYVRAGAPVMSVVGTERIWIEANFKETELTHVRVGQPVSISIDSYPDRKWHGTVQSISQATGAEFSILPPQNATGNWVKVVQRIPVRITIDSQESDPDIRAGMSAQVEIDTGFRRSLPGFSTTALQSFPHTPDNRVAQTGNP